MSYLPSGTTTNDVNGRVRGDEESILDAFESDVREALIPVPSLTPEMLEAVCDVLIENFGDDIIEKRRIDPADEQ